MKTLIAILAVVLALPALAENVSNQCPKIEGRWFCHDLGMPRSEDETSFFYEISSRVNSQGEMTFDLNSDYEGSGKLPLIVLDGVNAYCRDNVLTSQKYSREFKLVTSEYMLSPSKRDLRDGAVTFECARVPHGTSFSDVYANRVIIPWP